MTGEELIEELQRRPELLKRKVHLTGVDYQTDGSTSEWTREVTAVRIETEGGQHLVLS